MNNQLSKLFIGLLGFVAGIAFLISCGGGGGTGVSLPINDADANVPQITDQMYCHNQSLNATPYDLANENETGGLFCMKQSTKVGQMFNNLSEIYAEGWIMISMVMPDSIRIAFNFYK